MQPSTREQGKSESDCLMGSFFAGMVWNWIKMVVAQHGARTNATDLYTLKWESDGEAYFSMDKPHDSRREKWMDRNSDGRFPPCNSFCLGFLGLNEPILLSLCGCRRLETHGGFNILMSHLNRSTALLSQKNNSWSTSLEKQQSLQTGSSRT